MEWMDWLLVSVMLVGDALNALEASNRWSI